MTTDSVGGVWTYSVDLARALVPLGMATTLVVIGPSPAPADAADARSVPELILLDPGLPLDWLADSEQEVRRAGAAVGRLARETDLVQLNSPALAAFGDFDRPIVGVCHSCVATWWAALRAGPPDADIAWRHSLIARGYANCDVLVAPSFSFATATSRAYGVSPRVVHNGRSIADGPMTLRERLVLTAGRLWDDGKNIAGLDAAAAHLDAPVLAAGPLESPSGSIRALQHARSLGRLDPRELRRWMSRASVFASMALYEPFGLTVLEAAQAGCALVLSDIETFRELWDGVADLIPADRPDILVKTIRDLLDNPVQARARGDAAQQRARMYSADAMARAMHATFEQLLDARHQQVRPRATA